MTKRPWRIDNSTKFLICELNPNVQHMVVTYEGKYYCVICKAIFDESHFNNREDE